jgi:hypothetical protein
VIVCVRVHGIYNTLDFSMKPYLLIAFGQIDSERCKLSSCVFRHFIKSYIIV